MNEIELTEQFQTKDALIKRLKEENEQLKEGIKEALELAEACWGYVPEYFSRKWGLEDDLNRLKERWGE